MGARGMCPPGPNSFNFMQFLRTFGKIVCWRPPSPRGVGVPSSGKSCIRHCIGWQVSHSEVNLRNWWWVWRSIRANFTSNPKQKYQWSHKKGLIFSLRNGKKTFMSRSSCLIHSKFGKLGNIKSVEKYKVNNFKIQYNREKWMVYCYQSNRGMIYSVQRTSLWHHT